MTGLVCASGWVAFVAACLALPPAVRRAAELTPWRALLEQPPIPWPVLATASLGVVVQAAKWGLIAAHVAVHVGGGW